MTCLGTTRTPRSSREKKQQRKAVFTFYTVHTTQIEDVLSLQPLWDSGNCVLRWEQMKIKWWIVGNTGGVKWREEIMWVGWPKGLHCCVALSTVASQQDGSRSWSTNVPACLEFFAGVSGYFSHHPNNLKLILHCRDECEVELSLLSVFNKLVTF